MLFRRTTSDLRGVARLAFLSQSQAEKMRVLGLLVLAAAALVQVSGSYVVKCESAICRVLEDGNKEISKLKKDIDDGAVIQGFGQKADEIINESFTKFSQLAPLDSKSDESIYDKKVEDLEKLLDAPLHVLYLKQLSVLR